METLEKVDKLLLNLKNKALTEGKKEIYIVLSELKATLENERKRKEKKELEYLKGMARSKREAGKWILAGKVFVDSGQLIVGDPCCFSDFGDKELKRNDEYTDKKFKGKFSYWGACNATAGSSKGYGQLERGTAVVFSSGYGDGTYKVFVKKNRQGKTIKALIDMSS